VSQRDPIESYLADLRRRLRWRRGRARLVEEVEDHLREMARAEQAQGVNRAEAERRAIEHVGAAAAIVPRRRVGLAVAAFAVAGSVTIGSVLLAHVGNDHPATGGLFALNRAALRLVTAQIHAIDTRMTRGYVRVSLRRAEQTARIPLILPIEPAASNRTLDSVWSLYGEGKAFMLVYRSGLVEQLTRWQIHGRSPTSVLREMTSQDPGTRFTKIHGSPAQITPSNIHPQPILGFAPPMWQFGIPATVVLVRDDTIITLQRWGRNTLPSVLRAGRRASHAERRRVHRDPSYRVELRPHRPTLHCDHHKAALRTAVITTPPSTSTNKLFTPTAWA
jgi:hypothetical protein